MSTLNLLITVGTGLEPFNRLITMANQGIAQSGIAVDGVCQFGSCTERSEQLENTRSLTRAAFRSQMDKADLVLCHAGVGTLRTALDFGHRPLVMARLRRHGEVVNDHQKEIVDALTKSGQIEVIHQANDIARLLRRGRPERVVVAESSVPKALQQALSRPPVWSTGPGGSAALALLARVAPPLSAMLLQHDNQPESDA